ncbi:PAS domain-containing sensor histidine kinase [Rhizobium leguminosarum]|uniref:PAS domain-containing sensor histidine kinase n=1 Tax=Rhizobium leguminosarum TaxID=384 RepID=UPI00103937D3|nr:PAS domain-containing sensor histidine kinase [Rhizobium leguminosarum]MBY5794911.1 PAS domain-containing protein [Rhizobium leguminosarum]NKK26977.1 PAS domain-containing protein [Rhizobium leguminosarum bv. viciae]NKK68111.1 PAS domain-containing protein [Rhizobium leguminosarum bv. viciae]TBZ97466.1 PAS domain S-box protein [Rhizobium leguminosarum bv. viciae]
MSISLNEQATPTEPDAALILDHLPGLVWTTDETGTISYCNARFGEYAGIDFGLSRSSHWASVLHPDDVIFAVQYGRSARWTEGHAVINARLRRNDGEFRWFELAASPLADGGKVCWLGTELHESASERAQEEIESRFRRFLNCLSLPALLITPALELEFANHAALRWYGFRPEGSEQVTSADMESRKFDEILLPLKAYMEGEQTAVVSYQAQHADGTLRSLEAQVVPIIDKSGELTNYVVLQNDVQDSRDAAYLFGKEMKILDMVARGTPSARVLQELCNVVDDLIPDLLCCFLELSLDRKFFRMGAAPRLPSEFREIFDRKSVAADKNACSVAALSKKAVEIQNLGESDHRDTSMGQFMLANKLNYCHAIPILSPFGNTAGIFAILRHQYTELKPHELQIIDRAAHIAGISIDRTRHEEALVKRETQFERSQAQLVAAQRISSTGSFTSDIQRDENIWSEEFYRIFDLDPKLAPSIDAVRERIHPEDLERFNVEMQRGLTGEGSDFVFRIIRTDASVRFIRGLAKVTRYVGDHPIFMGTVQDITETKRAEDALRRGEEALLKAREELAYVSRAMTISALTTSIAHEVSQPLSGILANANACVRLLALDPPDIATAADTARRTIRDTMRATEVVKRLRAMFSRQAPTMEEIDLNEIAREVIALSARDMRERSILLESRLASGLPSVRGDRIQLQQVILNLVLNGIEAMAEIEGRPRRLLVLTSPDEDMLTLSIVDAGVGIAADSAERLFEPFFTTKRNGMGIGLSISRSIIENHGGSMWATPNDGPGTTVAFSIPKIPPLAQSV